MRLWHKSLIPVLPREQLVAQWRECSAIAGNILTKGTPNHLLVNQIMNYDLSHFISYAWYIREEMTRRGYRTMDSVWNKITSVRKNWEMIPIEDLFYDWMNLTYLTICYMNLYEKHLCNGINDENWDPIYQLYFKNTKNFGIAL